MRSLLLLISLVGSIWVSAAEPDHGLRTTKGESVQLQQYAGGGKWLVVMIWSVTCSICLEEMPRYSDFHLQRKDRDIHVLGVSLDGQESAAVIRAYMQDLGVRFPTVIAELGSFARWYQSELGESLRGTPTFLLYTPQGKLIANNPGPMRISALESYISRRGE